MALTQSHVKQWVIDQHLDTWGPVNVTWHDDLKRTVIIVADGTKIKFVKRLRKLLLVILKRASFQKKTQMTFSIPYMSMIMPLKIEPKGFFFLTKIVCLSVKCVFKMVNCAGLSILCL